MSLAAALHRNPPRLRTLGRWTQVIASVVGMMAIAAVVFVWPLLRSSPGRAAWGQPDRDLSRGGDRAGW